jgi:hypothetical protein
VSKIPGRPKDNQGIGRRRAIPSFIHGGTVPSLINIGKAGGSKAINQGRHGAICVRQ